MQLLLDMVSAHKANGGGVYSVCSAHPLVLASSLRHARDKNVRICVIESTSNQVNQEGGYTGMTPEQFRDFVEDIAVKVGFPLERLVLGGDHLGPHVWRNEPKASAMAKAAAMIDAYVSAGYRKIHLDCSMPCADDPDALTDHHVAERAAELCAVAEAAAARVGGEAPVYIIGTEVPPPGGAAEALDQLEPTPPQAAMTTLQIHREVFADAGLEDAWARVIGLVVQPGVEFDTHSVVDYKREAAKALSSSLDDKPGIVFEAHSTDYQSSEALSALVEDHYAILKVGPGLTFALREALFALDKIAADWLDEPTALRKTTLDVMHTDPKYWTGHYNANSYPQDIDLIYSYSDRIRYYWPNAEIERERSSLFKRLEQKPPPEALVSQHLPSAYSALRAGKIENLPDELVHAHLCTVLDSYAYATGGH